MSAAMSTDEMFESLTGFDEVAIAKRFGDEWQTLARGKPVMFLRALAFIAFRRDGLDDGKAYTSAMELTVREANEFFQPEPDEVMPEEPVTPLDDGA